MLFSQLRIEDRVLFPDHVLLILSNRIQSIEGLNCVYYEKTANDTSDEIIRLQKKNNLEVVLLRPVLSLDDYDERYRSIVRCPLPPMNYSAAVNLQMLDDRKAMNAADNQTVAHSWDMMAYDAALDGNTAVVFVKGLNLRPDRESNPTQFSCHFGLGNWERNEKFVLTTRAITVAQEVVRCSLPRSIRKNPNKAQGIRVTVGVAPYIHGHIHSKASTDHVILPSIAKLPNSNNNLESKNWGRKHELCVCTMVWNQASALREWVKYHSWLGVERWFVYDNNSDDGIKETIEELELENYNVSRHTWPWIKTQEAGFSHCALRAREECNWVGFFDVDEFFYFPFPTHNRRGISKLNFPGQNSLRTLVTNFSSATTIGEIRTACHSFGPSGLSTPPPQGVTVGYTCRLQSPERHKSIVRLDALDTTLLNVVHHFHLKKGFRYLNLIQSTAVINHYKYQVWEVFRAKFYRRVATYVADWHENQNEGSKDRAPGLGTEAIEPPNWPLQFCEVWDTGLRDFVLANLVDPTSGLLPWERSLSLQ